MAKVNDIRVILVRCGRTEWDDCRRLQGRTDLPLSESGREAAAATVRDLASQPDAPPVGLVYAGPDEASLETAAMVASAMGAAKVRIVENLAGTDLGIWDGLLESQVMERFPTAYRQWKERPASVNPPEGETFDEGATRVRLAMCKLLEKANGKAMVFVLRPIPFAVANLWLNGRPMNDLWKVLEDGPQCESVLLPRDRIRSAREEMLV